MPPLSIPWQRKTRCENDCRCRLSSSSPQETKPIAASSSLCSLNIVFLSPPVHSSSQTNETRSSQPTSTTWAIRQTDCNCCIINNEKWIYYISLLPWLPLFRRGRSLLLALYTMSMFSSCYKGHDGRSVGGVQCTTYHMRPWILNQCRTYPVKKTKDKYIVLYCTSTFSLTFPFPRLVFFCHSSPAQFPNGPKTNCLQRRACFSSTP